MAHILVADDSMTFREELKSDLREAGHNVITAEDGPDAIEKIKAHSDLELLILDVNMPGCSGLEVLKNIRKEANYSNMVKFLLTTESSPEMKAEGKSLGVKAWITKPYNKDTLIGAIEKVLAK